MEHMFGRVMRWTGCPPGMLSLGQKDLAENKGKNTENAII
jgi:hypothetical protein